MPMARRTQMLLNVDNAQVTTTPQGAVTVDDPGCPLIVTVRVSLEAHRVQLDDLQVTSKPGWGARITPATLSRLPLQQVVMLAAARLHSTIPNEAVMRLLARPKPPGQRSWSPEHYQAVLTVFQWARDNRRPGGGVQAVAEFWGVNAMSTAKRWLATARRLAVAPAPAPDTTG